MGLSKSTGSIEVALSLDGHSEDTESARQALREAETLMSETEDQTVQPIVPLDPELSPTDHPQAPPAPAGAGAQYPWPPTQTASPAAAPESFWHRVAAAVVLAAVVAAAAGAGIGWSLARNFPGTHSASVTQPESPLQPENPQTGGTNGGGGRLNVAAIAAKVDPAIVDINTLVGSNSAAGTGMIVSATGEVLTNDHVVRGSSSIKATIAGRSQSYSAHVIAVDRADDVALIQIEGVSNLPTVKFANSSSLSVGDPIVVIGNALGAGGTPHATQGSITALDQTITAGEGAGQSEQLSGMIQSDAVIYPGDSGGPIVNAAGQVVGMTTAGQPEGYRSSASNVGYAIPSNIALGVVNRIRSGEQASDLIYGQIGYLGVSVQSLDAASAGQLGLAVDSGAFVSSVVPGSPADSAGLPRNSVITALGGSPVTSSDTLGTAIQAHKPGDAVSVTWVTSSGSHTSTVTLAGVNP
jgi:S1-C subfamily serine protease